MCPSSIPHSIRHMYGRRGLTSSKRIATDVTQSPPTKRSHRYVCVMCVRLPAIPNSVSVGRYMCANT